MDISVNLKVPENTTEELILRKNIRCMLQDKDLSFRVLYNEFKIYELEELIHFLKQVKTQKIIREECINFGTAPRDILVNIFKYLLIERVPYRETPKNEDGVYNKDISILSCVCKTWRKLFIEKDFERFESFIKTERGAFIISVILFTYFSWKGEWFWFLHLKKINKSYNTDQCYTSDGSVYIVKYSSRSMGSNFYGISSLTGIDSTIYKHMYNVGIHNNPKNFRHTIRSINALFEFRLNNSLIFKFIPQKTSTDEKEDTNIDLNTPLHKLFNDAPYNETQSVNKWYKLEEGNKFLRESEKEGWRSFNLSDISAYLSDKKVIKYFYDSVKQYNHVSRFW